MKKNIGNMTILGLIIVGIIFAIPSILYLLNFNSVDAYNGTFYYFIDNDGIGASIIGSIIFIILILLSFGLYFRMIKSSQEFSLKKILFSVLLIGLVFLIALPNTSTDVFYYMGTGRLLEEYGENPYYTTIEEVLKENANDSILRNSGPWKFSTVVYGPVWVIICFIFNKICFGSATLLLYIFKISALVLHIANCIIIYKITKKKKMVILYGFNPLILIEFMINAHNDIYLVFFVLLAIYFLKNKKNIWMTLIMLAISVGIKYITLLLVPIFVLYHLQNKKIIAKIGYIMIYAIFFLFLIYIMYLPFANNISTMITSITQQQSKVKDSVYLILSVILNNKMILTIIFCIAIMVMIYYYIIICLKLLMRKENFRDVMKDTSGLLLFLIFGVLTNIGSWYLSWLFMSMYWLKGKDIKKILWVQLLYELTYGYLYIWHSDAYQYAVIVIPTIMIGTILRSLYLQYTKNKLKN